jgi:hypothetical protein
MHPSRLEARRDHVAQGSAQAPPLLGEHSSDILLTSLVCRRRRSAGSSPKGLLPR